MTRIVRHLKKYLQAYSITFAGFLISLGLFFALQIQEEHYVYNIAQLGIETIYNNIQSELAFDAHILKHVAKQAKSSKNSAPFGIADLLATYPRLYALAQINPNRQLKWITLQKHTKVAEISAFINSHAAQITNTSSTWIATPSAANQSKAAFFMVTPQGKQGYLIALFDGESLRQHAARIPNMIFNIYLNQHLFIQDEDDTGATNHWLFAISQETYGALIEIKAQENTINVGPLRLISVGAPISWITLILGFSISLLLARSITLSKNLQREISDHIETEKSKKSLEKALLQGQKLQAIGTLAAGIAHDFNNLLYAIGGYAELARDDVPKEEITYKNLGKVLEATHRGQDLISRILAFSRPQHHELTALNLNMEITAALALLRPAIPEGVEIQFHANNDGHIKGNKTQIHQVIVNLLNNAVDAMNSEGKITIDLSCISKGRNYCKIEISDTGHGMDQPTMERIFEPFYTTKEVGKGTGLGLSTVHSIMKEHQGEVTVTSEVGKGTTFTLLFPESLEKERTHGQNITS